MIMETDVLVIGGGAAGIGAAVSAAKAGVNVILVESEELGGILNRCIHSGFGLKKYKKDFTGTEYAEALKNKVIDLNNVKRIVGTVRAVTPKLEAEVISESGAKLIKAKAIVLATGSRERAFGALEIGGTHPAGIMTAGEAQKLVNLGGHAIGKKIVILGSGDIGLIMARRLTLEGAKVEAVIEQKPFAGGLMRNVIQCLNDFNIPLMLSTTVVEVVGNKRVEEVITAKVDEKGKVIKGTESTLQCDTLLISVGLLPLITLLPYAEKDERTKSVQVNSHFETSVMGIFACGNCLHIHDLADNAEEEGEVAGYYAAKRAMNNLTRLSADYEITCGQGVMNVVPMLTYAGEKVRYYIRANGKYNKAELSICDKKFTLQGITPNETIAIDAVVNRSGQVQIKELV